MMNTDNFVAHTIDGEVKENVILQSRDRWYENGTNRLARAKSKTQGKNPRSEVRESTPQEIVSEDEMYVWEWHHEDKDIW